MRFLATVGALLAATAMTGCGHKAPPPAAKAAPAPAHAAAPQPHGIDWFPGSVPAAFAAAKAANKPLFLYWGAVWCPPCAQIKATIFSRREFQERTRLFVPVYLDGDTPSAQKYGEQFGVVGYPTMILFRADGTEITRLPGGVDIARYAKILDVALAAARPVAEILAAARTGGEVSPDDWRLLAYYSWATDNGHVLPAAQGARTFRALAERCPAELLADCSRFWFEYVGAAAATAKGGRPPFDGLQRAEARRRILELLARPAVQQANVEHLLYGAPQVVGALSAPGTAERGALTAAWSRALDALAALEGQQALSTKEQLNLLRARVLLAKLEAPDAPLPPALLETVRRAVTEVDAHTTDPAERQAAINAAVALYWDAGLEAEAGRLLTAELGKSKSPYYFMLDLADLAEKAGRKQEAVEWLGRAYREATGPATRFQWGYDYLVGLIEMTPDDLAGIERAGLAVLDELDGAPDAFYQRTRIRLEQLSNQLLAWGPHGARARVVEKLRERTRTICAKLPQNDDGRTHCEAFLTAARHAKGEAAT